MNLVDPFLIRNLRAENERLHEAIRKLHRVWFTGADVDKDAVSVACLELFATTLVSPAEGETP